MRSWHYRVNGKNQCERAEDTKEREREIRPNHDMHDALMECVLIPPLAFGIRSRVFGLFFFIFDGWFSRKSSPRSFARIAGGVSSRCVSIAWKCCVWWLMAVKKSCKNDNGEQNDFFQSYDPFVKTSHHKRFTISMVFAFLSTAMTPLWIMIAKLLNHFSKGDKYIAKRRAISHKLSFPNCS